MADMQAKPGARDMADRPDQRIISHYTIERELAARLRAAPANERALVYGEVYEELFRRVPDHPQLAIVPEQRDRDGVRGGRPGEPVPERPAHRSPLAGRHHRPARRHHRRRMRPGLQRSGLPPGRRALQGTVHAAPSRDVQASSRPRRRGPAWRRHPGGEVPGHAGSGPVRSLREIHRRPVEGLTGRVFEF